MEYIELSYACVMDGDWISQEVLDSGIDDGDDDDVDDSVLREVDVSLQTRLQTSLIVILHVIYKLHCNYKPEKSNSFYNVVIHYVS